MKKIIFGLTLLASMSSFAEIDSIQEIVSEKGILKLSKNEEVLIDPRDSLGTYSTSVKFVTSSDSDDKYIFEAGERVLSIVYAKRANLCLDSQNRTLCIGDKVVKNYIDADDEIAEVVGIQVKPSGFFGKRRHIYIKTKRGLYIPQEIEDVNLIEE